MKPLKVHRSVRIERDLFDSIESRAEKENRDFTNMLEFLLREALQKTEQQKRESAA